MHIKSEAERSPTEITLLEQITETFRKGLQIEGLGEDRALMHLQSPKSLSFASACFGLGEVSRMFSSFRSLWTIMGEKWCRYSKASEIWSDHRKASCTTARVNTSRAVMHRLHSKRAGIWHNTGAATVASCIHLVEMSWSTNRQWSRRLKAELPT